jgi:hypothetical protein
LLTHFDETHRTGPITCGARGVVPCMRLDLMEEANDITTEGPRPDAEISSGDALRLFVEEMARFSTATDDLRNEEFRIAFAREHRLKPEEISEDEILAELSEERLYNETMAFWEMIRRARHLIARAEP